MTGYIAGITIGSLVVLLGVALFTLRWWKGRTVKKLIKRLGTAAEESINADIKVWAKHTNNKFIPSTLFKYGHDKVFEVDSVIVTQKALIVVEIKSIKGGIEGTASAPKWEKVLGSVRHDITNPIIQNDKHIQHIISMLETKIPTISLIVFSNRAQYLNIKEAPSHVVVTRQSELFDILDEINASLPQSMNEDQVKDIYNNIRSFKVTKSSDIKLHKNITTKGHGGK